MRIPLTGRALARAALAVGLLVPAAAAADAAELTASRTSLREWTPLVQRTAAIQLIRAGADGRVVRLRDGKRGAGYVVLSTRTAPQVTMIGTARLNVRRQRMALRSARAMIELRGEGRSVEAGPYRDAAGNVRWAAWTKGADGGRRALAVSPEPVRMSQWSTVTLASRWAGDDSRASLRIDGRVVVRLPKLVLPMGATSANIGLGRASRKGEKGVLLVRNARVWGTELQAPVQADHAHVAAVAPEATPDAAAPPAATPPAAPPAAPAPTPTPPAQPPITAPPAIAPPILPGREVARLDFENGFGNAGFQAVSRDRITQVTNPVAAGRYAGRFEVRPGDTPIDSSERAELSLDTGESEGEERWYSWAVMFDQGFPSGGQWQVVSQFHSTAPRQPPVGFYAENNRFRLQVWPKNADGSQAAPERTIWSTTLQRGVWYRITLHARWSGSDTSGFVELFVNGKPAGSKTYIRTLAPGSPNYFKMGYYRNSGFSQTGVVYIDDFRATQVN